MGDLLVALLRTPLIRTPGQIIDEILTIGPLPPGLVGWLLGVVEIDWYRRHPWMLRALAGVGPLVVSGGLYFVDYVANSAAALVLVLAVVGAAATGDRTAGLLAGLSATVGFAYFLTKPYLQFRIDSAEDIELAVLLLLVALAVSELACWGIRQSVAAHEVSGFVTGVLESADLASGSTPVAEALGRVSATIGRTLGAEQVSFVYGDHDAGAAVIGRDGSVRCRGATLDVQAVGLPSGPDACTAIPIAQHGAQIGYFRICSPTRVLRPTRDQLRVIVLLAWQWSLRAQPLPPRRTALRP